MVIEEQDTASRRDGMERRTQWAKDELISAVRGAIYQFEAETGMTVSAITSLGCDKPNVVVDFLADWR